MALTDSDHNRPQQAGGDRMAKDLSPSTHPLTPPLTEEVYSNACFDQRLRG